MTTPLQWLDDSVAEPFRDMLLAGTAGRKHLLRTAAMAAAQATTPAARHSWLERRQRLLTAAFEEDCLFGPTAAALLQVDGERPGKQSALAPTFAALLTAVANRFVIPENTAYYQRLLAAGEATRLQRYLENECRRDSRYSLFWLHVAFHRAILTREFDWGTTLVQQALPEDMLALEHKLAGDLALLSSRCNQALPLYEASLALAPRSGGHFRPGLAAWQTGATTRAQEHFAAQLVAIPEHVSAALALYDLLTKRDAATAPPPASLAIVLYTYNKADDLDRTLSSLFASTIGQARVTVLDNASVDATPQVLAAWSDRVGSDRFSTLRLPVNVGAPAARNWLATDARANDAETIAYLDDDVDLPQDWLGKLAAAMAFYPEAGVWGARVVDATNPAVAQGVDAMLTPGHDGEANTVAEPWLSDIHAETFDYGAFTHLRPSLSVMGCCHLFRRDRLQAAGGFDIRYSPSQYDDVDHDLRLVLDGHPPVYQGHLVVAHRRPAPVFAPSRLEQKASGEANRYKLLAKFRDRFAALGNIMRRTATADLAAKWQAIVEAGIVPPPA